MTEIVQLIIDLEAAPVGSRELSDRMLYELGFYQTSKSGRRYWCYPGRRDFYTNAPDPSRCVDDVLALVPEDHTATLFLGSFDPRQGVAILNPKKYGHSIISEGATPALALTIAILKGIKS